MNYEFNEQTFEQFFTAVQEVTAFEMAEIWEWKAYAEFGLLEVVDERAKELGDATYSGLVAQHGEGESVDSGIAPVQILVASLRKISATDWKELFERINVVEQILRKDPCGAYAPMPFQSPPSYLTPITPLATRSMATSHP